MGFASKQKLYLFYFFFFLYGFFCQPKIFGGFNRNPFFVVVFPFFFFRCFSVGFAFRGPFFFVFVDFSLFFSNFSPFFHFFFSLFSFF